MPKNDTASDLDQPIDDKAYKAAIEDKVRQMLDPEIKDPEPDSEPVAEPGANDSTAESDDTSPKPEPAVDKPEEKPTKHSRWQKFRRGWHEWWRNPVKRRLSIAGILIALVATFGVPTSRYFVLNNLGVRSKASMVVIDESTRQPLKNVKVILSGQSVQTNSDGQASFRNIKLGKQSLVVEKRAFAELKKNITIGWGSNPLGDISITPTGSQYSFEITDFLSGKPLTKVEAISGDFNAQSDETGLIKLVIDDNGETSSADVMISLDGYRVETINLDLNTKDATKVAMVPSQKHFFVSKRSGRYDIFKIDADGQNETKILSGSGAERDDLVLVPHPTNGYVALVSTRENVRNSSGFLLSTLTLIDPMQNIPAKVAQSEQIQIIDWIKDRLIYVQITEGSSAVNPDRQKLMSYDIASGKSTELAKANYFNDVISVNGAIYYAPSATYSTDAAGFFKISSDGTSKQTVHNQEVWNIFRTEYDKLVVSSGSDWYTLVVSSGKLTKLSGEPPNLKARIYVLSSDGKHALWTDDRDGKGVLLNLDITSNKDEILIQLSGLQNPVRWLNDRTVVFRVSTGQETADYVMSLDGGEAQKIRDVTKSAGIDRWYYY